MNGNDRRNLRQIKVTNEEFNFLLNEAARRGLIKPDERQGEAIQRLLADYIIPEMRRHNEPVDY